MSTNSQNIPRVCKYYYTAVGCSNGASCKFLHCNSCPDGDKCAFGRKCWYPHQPEEELIPCSNSKCPRKKPNVENRPFCKPCRINCDSDVELQMLWNKLAASKPKSEPVSQQNAKEAPTQPLQEEHACFTKNCKGMTLYKFCAKCFNEHKFNKQFLVQRCKNCSRRLKGGQRCNCTYQDEQYEEDTNVGGGTFMVNVFPSEEPFNSVTTNSSTNTSSNSSTKTSSTVPLWSSLFQNKVSKEVVEPASLVVPTSQTPLPESHVTLQSSPCPVLSVPSSSATATSSIHAAPNVDCETSHETPLSSEGPLSLKRSFTNLHVQVDMNKVMQLSLPSSPKSCPSHLSSSLLSHLPCQPPNSRMPSRCGSPRDQVCDQPCSSPPQPSSQPPSQSHSLPIEPSQLNSSCHNKQLFSSDDDHYQDMKTATHVDYGEFCNLLNKSEGCKSHILQPSPSLSPTKSLSPTTSHNPIRESSKFFPFHNLPRTTSTSHQPSLHGPSQHIAASSLPLQRALPSSQCSPSPPLHPSSFYSSSPPPPHSHPSPPPLHAHSSLPQCPHPLNAPVHGQILTVEPVKLFPSYDQVMICATPQTYMPVLVKVPFDWSGRVIYHLNEKTVMDVVVKDVNPRS